MIRLLEDCEARELFKKGHPEALRRYWVFAAYSSPCYRFPSELDMDDESKDEYIQSFLYPGESFIDVGKFDLAFPVFDMDEWTTIVGFVSSREEAPEIAKLIEQHQTIPEEVVARYPRIELIELLWVDGWWEIFGDIEVASDLIKPDLAFVDTETSVFLNRNHDAADYRKARRELQQKVEARQRKGKPAASTDT